MELSQRSPENCINSRPDPRRVLGGLSAVCGVSNSNDPGDPALRRRAAELALDLCPPEQVCEMLRSDCFCGSIAASRGHALLACYDARRDPKILWAVWIIRR
jgi:hypothetical protein